jgi:hypothetical protein
MGMFDSFFQKADQQNPQGQQGPQGQQPFPNGQQPAPQGQMPGQGQQNPADGQNGRPQNQEQQLPNPADLYKDLFAQSAGNEEQAPQFSLSPELMDKTVSNLDFNSGMPDELQTKIRNGEQLSTEDIMSYGNHVARQAYKAAMMHGSKLTGTYVDLHSKHVQKGLPQMFNEHLVSNKLKSGPASSNPVVSQQLAEIGSRIAKKYPSATPEWIEEKSKEYFMQMARELNPDAFKPTQEQQQRVAQDQAFDWDAFMQKA